MITDSFATRHFRHRIAVANIATQWQPQRHAYPFAIQNDNARKRGAVAYGAVGGGAIITPAGMIELHTLGDIRFEEHIPPIGYDARMILSARTPAALARLRIRVLQTVLTWARTGDKAKLELNIERELREELVEDTPGIITEADLATIQHQLIGWKCGTVRSSSRGPEGIDTTPFYLCHALRFEEVGPLNRITRRDPLQRVRIIEPEELRTTANGRREGRTADGHVLFSNVFPHELVRPL